MKLYHGSTNMNVLDAITMISTPLTYSVIFGRL